MQMTLGGKSPRLDASALVVASADLIGDVTIAAEASIWFQVVLRGDINAIRIGMRTNIQDGTIGHVSRSRPLVIGDEVTVGHRAILHACEVRRGCLVGMGAIVMDGAIIGEDSLVGAGALVTQGTVIPPRSLVLGAPATVRRPLSDDELAFLQGSWKRYVGYAKAYHTDAR
ncbi:MAG: gamma carbonic anhydrase family protein [Deltaproteobacteria bacterium]|nr:gamma carbonic anhydrase family protein [Deltaproteobacteria bacterium]